MGTIEKSKPTKEDVIRIEMIDKPYTWGPGEGLYEWRWCDQKFTVDMIDLKKEIEKIPKFEKMGERIMDRIQNFPVLYLNMRTGEVTSR